MKGFDVLNIKSAVKARNKMTYNYSHLTTMDIGQIAPLCAIDCIAGDNDFEVDANLFSRVAPLVRPTYGKFKLKTMAGYVPYHMIAADAEAWLDGKTSWEGYTPLHRYFTFGTLMSFLLDPSISTTTGATQANCDFTHVASGTRRYDLFTKKGKYFIKVLNALGYAIPSDVDLTNGTSWHTNERVRKLSAYPLLCFFKLYNDYMSQSQRFNTSQLSNILNAVKY